MCQFIGGQVMIEPSLPLQVNGHDPLKWFGVLVPQSLRQSADRFGSAARIGVECANLQNELRGVEDRKKYLTRMLAKRAEEAD